MNTLEIRFTSPGDITCGGFQCDPFALYTANAQCGDCPVISLCRQFVNIEFEI